MISNTTGGFLAAALMVIAMSAQAQNGSETNDISGKQYSRSGANSVAVNVHIWTRYRDAQQAKINRMQARVDAMQQGADRQMMRSLIGDLVNERILRDPKDLVWLALTGDKLIVNGKKQRSALHRKFKSKYIYKSGYGIFYGDPSGKISDKSESTDPEEERD
jgi:hypothetical protein